ncbi:hypothetical protein OG933_05170 [Streptomyces sp. NBC_00016]|uniref:hypothetical protein n=1 Tax=Streptomyces sp. NBC_00016 TaxID=2975622 RepID=UPI0032445F73
MPTAEHQDATVLTDEEPRTLDAYGRAANCLAAGQLCLMAHPLLTEPLRPERRGTGPCRRGVIGYCCPPGPMSRSRRPRGR